MYSNMLIYIFVLFGLSMLSSLIFADKSSFIISLQSSLSFSPTSSVSIEEWAVYNEAIPRINQFTACHWEYQTFFNKDRSCVWSYCVIGKKNKNMKCLQYIFKGDVSTLNRHIIGKAQFDLDKSEQLNANINPYRHRQWNHVCWTYDKKDGNASLYFNGKMMGSMVVGLPNDRPYIEGSEEADQSAFVIGQEQDGIGEGYQSEQAFIGDVTELNIWDKVFDENEIKMMATCQSFSKGNIVSWDREKWEINKAKETILVDKRSLCDNIENILVLSKRMGYEEAKTVCKAHGGRIYTPRNEDENIKLNNIVSKNSDICLRKSTLQSFWLGAGSINGVWYEMDQNIPDRAIKFSNWKRSLGDRISGCTYLQHDKWNFETGACYALLCTACRITNTPVLTGKGFCSGAWYDWIFYTKFDDIGNVYYEGYKRLSNIVLEGNKWMFKSRKENNITKMELDIGDSNTFPVGRHFWDSYQPTCGMQSVQKQEVAISTCEFGKEFSCSSGHCIQIFQACDNVIDCQDGSDEENCELVKLPKSYRKVVKPQLEGHGLGARLPIETQIKILNIDFIDTVDMLVGFTIKIKFKWRDSRLKFTGLFNTDIQIGNTEEIQGKKLRKLWLPISNIIHENAVIGKVLEDINQYARVFANNNPLPMDSTEGREKLMYEGSENDIETVQRFKMTYRCNFNLLYFPFDHQKCDFILKMKEKNNMSVELTEYDPPIIYEGNHKLNEFYIQKLETSTILERYQSKFIFSVYFDRIYVSYLYSIYIKTFFLWLLAYLTLYINIKNFNNRIMVSVTTLLILVSMLTSINADLPKTSYFKYIDLWFLWYICNILLIITFHIFIDHIEHGIKTTNKIAPMDPEDANGKCGRFTNLFNKLSASTVNTCAYYITPILTLVFCFVYVYICFCQDIDCKPKYF